MGLEAYSVAVRVSLINGVTAGLMNISRAFAKTHGDAKALQRTLDQIRFKVLAGGALAGTGLFGLHLLGKTLPYAKEYARQLALMNTLGMKQSEIAKTVGDAWRTSYAVPTSTAAANLATFRELRSAFGSDTEGQAHASSMLPVVARMQAVMQSLTGKAQDHVGFDMVKAIELRTGVMTTEALQRNAELMSRAIIGMGGTISVADFHGALKMEKMGSNKLSDDFTYNYLPTLMQELKTAHGGGAQSAGTVLQSLYQQMHGRMTKAAMPLWVEGGLLKSSDIVRNATGQYQMKPGSVAGTELYEQNPFLWVQQYLRPAVAKIQAQHAGMSAETAINAMFSNRNAAFGAYNMFFKAAQYERDKTTISKADGGYAAYQKLLKTDPTLASQALHSQWQNIMAQIGYSIMPTLVSATLNLVGALRGLNQIMHEHPTTVKVLTIGFAALAAALTFGGTVILLSAAFSALSLVFTVISGAIGTFMGVSITLGGILSGIIWPITLCVGALTGLGIALYEIIKHWDASKGILANIKAELGMFFNWLAGLIRHVLPDFGKGSKPIGHHDAANSQRDTYSAHGQTIGHHDAAPSGSRFVAHRGTLQVSVISPVYVDSKLVAPGVAKIINGAIGSTSGAGRYDPTAALPAAALGNNR